MCIPDLQAWALYLFLLSLEVASWLKTSYFQASRQLDGPYAAPKT